MIIFIIKSHYFYIILNVFISNITKIFKNDILINNFIRKILNLKYINRNIYYLLIKYILLIIIKYNFIKKLKYRNISILNLILIIIFKFIKIIIINILSIYYYY